MKLKNIEIFTPYWNLQGWFTEKNAGEINSSGKIPGLNCGMNTEAGTEEEEANRKLLFGHLQLEESQVAFARQVHGNHVEVVREGGVCGEADAIVTEAHGLTLAVQVADCVAVLLADSESQVIGAVHAGWRGAEAGVVPAAVEKMRKIASARPDRMLAYLSPSISQKHYEVGKDVADKFPDHFVDSNSYEKPHLDLKGYVKQQLRDMGIPENQIETDRDCTFENKERYYSFRREGKQAGRMLALIRLR